jgi:OmpA-OmpF porin, OOP family
MKKLALSALLAGTLLGAGEYNYEVTPVVGYLWNSTAHEDTGAMGGVDNHALFGLEVQANNFSSIIKPELSMLYGRDSVNGVSGKTGVLTTMLNGVYEMDDVAMVTPFAKAGIGYEWYTNTHPSDYDGFLVDAGVGLKADLTKQIALKLEALYLYKVNHGDSANDSNGEVHNIAALAGVSFSFDPKSSPAPTPAPAPQPVAVVAPAPAPEPQPVVVPAPQPVAQAPIVVPAAPVVEAVAVAAVILDSDKDGVLDDADKCPATPSGYKVDAEGCPMMATLRLNFATSSNGVDAEGLAKVTEFATFLKASPMFKASIVGHTDSVGSEKSNEKLSLKRAEKVKSLLIEQGVEANRLSASGKGESSPIASNATKEGRAENRRIEVSLTR